MDVAAAEWAPGCDPMEREGHMLLGALLGTSFLEPRAVIFTEQKACAAWLGSKKSLERLVSLVGLEALCLSLRHMSHCHIGPRITDWKKEQRFLNYFLGLDGGLELRRWHGRTR